MQVATMLPIEDATLGQATAIFRNGKGGHDRVCDSSLS